MWKFLFVDGLFLPELLAGASIDYRDQRGQRSRATGRKKSQGPGLATWPKRTDQGFLVGMSPLPMVPGLESYCVILSAGHMSCPIVFCLAMLSFL